MAFFVCNGYWKDDSVYMKYADSHGGRREFIGEIITNEDSDEVDIEGMIEEIEDLNIFWVIDADDPIIGDHGELVIESAEPITFLKMATRSIN